MKHTTILRNALTALLAAAALFAASCQEEKESPTRMTLAVNDTTMNLSSKASQQHVLVYAKGSWNARLGENADWATLDKADGSGNGEFVLNVTGNDGLRRRADIVLTASGVSKTIYIHLNQDGALGNPKITFEDTDKHYIAWSTDDHITFKSNVDESLLKAEASEDWITGLTVEDGRLSYSVGENTTGEERTGTLILSYTDDEATYRATATITQGSEAGYLILDETQMTVEAYASAKSVTWKANLGTFFPSLTSSVTYEGARKDWISDIVMSEEGVTFNVAANEIKSERTATIKFELAEKGVSAELKVTQIIPTKQYSFAELRALLTSAGEYKFDGDWFEAVAVADGGKENMDTDPMLSASSIDYNESATTNYLQGVDGKYGLRIKVATAADNTLKRGDKVKVSLTDATLVREDNPVRYTLKGLTANSFTIESSDNAASVSRTVSQIGDDDIYTLVTLKNVEIAFCYGSYNNVRTTWISTNMQNFDYRILRDANGARMNMLVNSNTPWAITDNGVPQGSGDITGVVVSSTSDFHSAEQLGKYQIRPIDLSDIALKTTGFSETLVEWFWPGTPTDHKTGDTFDPSVGTGVMSSVGGKPNQTDSFLNFTGKPDTATDRARGTRFDAIWWKSGAANASVQWSFSTASVSGKKLAFIFSSAMGQMKEDATGQAPVNWNLEYSTDGTNFKTVQKVLIRPLPAKASKMKSLPAALDEYCIDLPAEVAGKDNVIIRLIPADGTTINFKTGEYTEQVTYAKAQYMRFGAVAVKYVK